MKWMIEGASSLDDGKKIETIKRLRNATRWGLKESKEIIDDLQMNKRTIIDICREEARVLQSEGFRLMKVPEDFDEHYNSCVETLRFLLENDSVDSAKSLVEVMHNILQLGEGD